MSDEYRFGGGSCENEHDADAPTWFVAGEDYWYDDEGMTWTRPVAPGRDPREVLNELANEAGRYLKSIEVPLPWDFTYRATPYSATVKFVAPNGSSTDGPDASSSGAASGSSAP